jgi:hypothetical protein
MRIEQYWFGYVVCNAYGVALSRAFKTRSEAQAYLERLSD